MDRVIEKKKWPRRKIAAVAAAVFGGGALVFMATANASKTRDGRCILDVERTQRQSRRMNCRR